MRSELRDGRRRGLSGCEGNCGHEHGEGRDHAAKDERGGAGTGSGGRRCHPLPPSVAAYAGSCSAAYGERTVDRQENVGVYRATLRLVGLEASYGAAPATLSGGMRKRASIARALVLAPPLLFLDEPSSGLDPITSAEIDRLIEMLARTLGLTVVLVTHELGSINAIVDRCILLDPETRRILATGTPRELAASTNPHVHHFFNRTPETL